MCTFTFILYEGSLGLFQLKFKISLNLNSSWYFFIIWNKFSIHSIIFNQILNFIHAYIKKINA